MVVLDTCCLIELCKPKPLLKRTTLDKIESAAAILSVSFAEIALKIKIRRLMMNLSAYDLYEAYRELAEIRIVEIGVQEWLDAIDLDWANKDPADRLIVAYAQKNKSSIVTSDKKIKSFYKDVLW